MTEKLLDKTKSDTGSPKDLDYLPSRPYSQVFGPQSGSSSLPKLSTLKKHFKREESCSSDDDKQHEQNNPNETSSQDEEGNTTGVTGKVNLSFS